MHGSIQIDRPIFVIGVGRSGTTLLQSMLNAHSQIAFPPETHFVREFLASPKMQGAVRQRKFRPIVERISQNESLGKLGVDLDSICTTLIDRDEFTLEKFYKHILAEYGSRAEKPRIGDKDPKNLEHLHEIHALFPDACVIHMIRDPRDVILSRTKAKWSKHRRFLTHVFTYEAQIQKARRDGSRLFGSEYTELLYENLISDPASILRELCESIGVEFEDGMLSYYETADQVIQGEEADWKENCFKPILSGNLGKWKSELPDDQVHHIESLCGTPFAEFGYPKSPRSTHRSFSERVVDHGIGQSFHLARTLYQLYHWLRIKRLGAVWHA